MKKICFLLVASLMLCHGAYAKHECNCEHGHMNSGGFVDANVAPVSIAEARKLSEDAVVSLQGHLTKRLTKDTYNFTDGTDDIVVEIDKKVWRGQMISPKEKVLIYGEIDKEDMTTEIDVKSIKIVQ